MEPKYVYILDFTQGILNIIHLTPEEIEESNKPEYEGDFESFLSSLESKYGFRLSDCQWMCSENLTVYRYEDGEEVSSPMEEYIKRMLAESEKEQIAWQDKLTKSIERNAEDVAAIQRQKRDIALGKIRAFQHILSKLEYHFLFQKQ